MKSNKWRNLAINYKNLSLLAFKPRKRNLISADLYKNIIYRYFDEFIKMSIKTLKIIANIDKIIPTQYKKSNGQIISQILDECVFVPLLDGTEQR
ncbi:hypothetical protein V2I21_03405 [Campylobacter sp. CLAX-22107-21]|uniref:hypothetical protein n=1 Tax=Campylobacter devanensis TaxID=3161138 RepID=UPI002EAFEF67|nr:hypothetical protein [Campylobacter sp. CLAX-22107-21]